MRRETAIQSYQDLLDLIRSLPQRRRTLLVGIDGPGAAGKSWLANALARLEPDVQVIHMDDFYLPSLERGKQWSSAGSVGTDFDWQRLRDQVLEPLARDQEAHYQRYDWVDDRLAEWHTTRPDGIVIVEGVYSTRLELADFYDFRIWVECPRDIRLARGLARDGDDAKNLWERAWMPAEDRYLETHRPADRADIIVDGSGLAGIDPMTHFVRIK